MTDTHGCERCGENTFSNAGDDSCTGCREGMASVTGSTSQNDCVYGKSGNKTNLQKTVILKTIAQHIVTNIVWIRDLSNVKFIPKLWKGNLDLFICY